jgi:hypothetical protein
MLEMREFVEALHKQQGVPWGRSPKDRQISSHTSRQKMFEVGKIYTIKTWEPDEGSGVTSEYPGCRVMEVQIPLIKIRQPGMNDAIITTASIAFINAIPDDDDNE